MSLYYRAWKILQQRIAEHKNVVFTKDELEAMMEDCLIVALERRG